MAVLDELLVRFGVDMSQAQEEVDSGSEGITGRLDGLAAAGTVAGAGLGAAFAVGVSTAMDITAATTELQNQLGITHDDAVQLSEATKSLFSSGLAGSVEEANEAVIAVKSSFKDMKDASVADIGEVAKESTVLARTFDVDVSEAASWAGSMVTNKLVKSSKEGLDLLTAAAPLFPKAMRAELPEALNEYGDGFAKIGLDGPTAIGLLSQAVQGGAMNVDEAGDIVHEFSRIVTEESDRAVEGFKALGLNGEQTLKAIQSGGSGSTQAMQDVTDALRAVKDPGEQAALITKIFGDRAGDSKDAVLALSPVTAGTAGELDNFAGAAGKAAEAAQSDPAVQLNSIMSTLGTTLGETLAPALSTVAGFLKDHPGLVQTLVPIVLALAVGLAIAAAAQWALNSALLANPYTWIVLAVVAIVAAIVLLWKKNEAFRNFVTAAWNMILGAIKKAWNWVKNNWPLVLGILTGPVGLAVGAIVNYWDNIVKFFKGIPGKISSIASGMWDPIWNAFKHMLNTIIWGWNNLSLTIGGGSIMGVDVPSLTLSTPNIPYLAKGGIATGPTLAMVGEGREDEAILPLSRLEQLINRPTNAPSTRRVQPMENRLVLELRGGSRAFREFFQESVKNTAGGDIVKYVEG
ncbi:hypothetical protein [Streptomyces sp. NPDC088812]|uniref:hypothetical protein n=1 Tax=Streptomyces sp. NPDC088812 TaxID=3365905 RepID=UPI00381A72D5